MPFSRGLSGSRETIKSTTSTMMNGHAGHGPLNYALNHPDIPHEKEHRDSRGSDVSIEEVT